ncbi:MAG: HAMP domain-containing histidine kinase [Anaerolineae bacterium]|nr:HAMP domain-containing histidine kinase [Anaerolineae bacterium]
MATPTFDTQLLLDGLGQSILIFAQNGKLVYENLASRTMLGTDITLLRSNGWSAATALFKTTETDPDKQLESYRIQTLTSLRPVRFYILHSGERIPCWASAISSEEGEICTMLSFDTPDWDALHELMTKFRTEMKDAIESTSGHIDIIEQLMKNKQIKDVEALAKRIGGFTRLINIHMKRVGRLESLMERLEDIRTGALKESLRHRKRKIALRTFLEDFEESLDEVDLVDPETDAHDHRSRVKIDAPNGVTVSASPAYLTRILHDLLRNAIMYSMKATPITIQARVVGMNAQIDVKDEGYGIREKEYERVFEAFQRARQPQIISEYGYGLNLYVCKHEVEAMNGRIWFTSEENIGTTFSIMLPLWQEETASSDSSSDSK